MSERQLAQPARSRLTMWCAAAGGFFAFALGCAESTVPDGSFPDAGPTIVSDSGMAPDAARADVGSYSHTKIARPTQGMYIGQYEFAGGDDTDAFEQATSRHSAMWSPYSPMAFSEGDAPPTFDAVEAQRAWDEGYVVIGGAYEASPGLGSMGFTVDRLLAGDYEVELRALAAQFRAFGKPMFFTAAREPNGALARFMGGFGPDGTKSIGWAHENRRGLADFDPSGFPHAELYTDLGDPTMCDGIERLVAAHRYYYDFFVRREGLGFLTFDTMGWGATQPPSREPEPGAPDLRSCGDFRNLYPGDDYVDWVSLTFYMGTEHTDDEAIAGLRWIMGRVREVAPDKPVFIVETGFPDGVQHDSAVAAARVQQGLEAFLSIPEIAGFTLWSRYHELTGERWPYDCLIRPGTQQAQALVDVLSANPSMFHTCAYLSDGQRIPTCPAGPPR